MDMSLFKEMAAKAQGKSLIDACLVEIESLRQQLHDADEALKAVERALKDVDYRGSYAEGVMELKQQLAEYKLKNKLHTEQADMYGKEASRHEDTIEFATEYALNTAKYLHQHFYADVTQWEPLDDLIGLQTQISNMVTGIGEQLAAALAACEAKDDFLQFAWRDVPMSDFAFSYLEETIAVKPDASALKAHDDALIEKIAQRMADSGIGGEYLAEGIRELKGTL